MKIISSFFTQISRKGEKTYFFNQAATTTVYKTKVGFHSAK